MPWTGYSKNIRPEPDLARRVRGTIERFRMFTPAQRAGVAVSGGADSVCLLHLLHELAPVWNLHLSVIHLNHGIRGAAAHEDAAFVHDLAAQFALPLHSKTVDVPAMGGNLEQAARNARREFFSELIASGVVDRIATG